MAFVKKEFYFRSVSDMANIHAASYHPESGEVRAVLQIAHGMAEHLERYEKFIQVLTDKGIAVYINDHLGHGTSVDSEKDLGYFGECGYNAMIEDCRQIMVTAKGEHPDVPYFFFGHSMGSFVARSFAVRYGDELKGAIFCGTGGSNPVLGLGIAIAKMVAKIKGDRHRSKFIDGLAFGAYNNKFEKRTNFDWLSRDNDEVDKYIADPLCGYLFTVNGLLNLFLILQSVSDSKWYEAFNKDLPVYLIAGDMDPVGNYGKGVKEVADGLKEEGVKDVSLTLYKDCRHEILNEHRAFDQVVADVLAFIDRLA